MFLFLTAEVPLSQLWVPLVTVLMTEDCLHIVEQSSRLKMFGLMPERGRCSGLTVLQLARGGRSAAVHRWDLCLSFGGL